MVDRRLLAVLIIVAVGVFAGRAALSGSPDPPTESEVSSEPTPAAPIDTALRAVEQPESRPTLNVDAPEANEPFEASPPPAADIVDVVGARRPTIDMVEEEHGDHPHDGERNPTGSSDANAVEVIAADLIVAGWTWRFDDSDTRQPDALASLADSGTIDALVPAPAERQRRFDACEVSWVIVRGISVDGTRATVRFDQHVISSSSAELVTARSVIVTIAEGLAVDIEVVL